MSFNQLADETFADAWECHHGLMTDLPTVGMEDWEFTQGLYYGLSQEAKEHIDTLVGWTFFMLNAEEAWALFEKLFASKREGKEHGLKENSHTVKINPLRRKFQSMALTQPTASETHQVEQEIRAQPSNGKKMPMSRTSSDAILDKLRNSTPHSSLHLGTIHGPSYFIFCLSSTICISLPFHPPFLFTHCPQHVYFIIA
jgi:hypothetical protein